MLLFVRYVDAATSMSVTVGEAVLPLILVGAKRMTRTNASMLTETLCASPSPLNVVTTVKTKSHVY